MENKNISKEKLNGITLGYALIVIITNLVGYFMANSGGMSVGGAVDYLIWVDFLNEHQILPIGLSVVAFVIPTVQILWYRRKMINGSTSIINMPFVYSALACIGWILSFVMEFSCLLYVKNRYDIAIGEIAIISFLNIIQESICIFTLSFLILNFIHRKFVLPRFYPEGNLSKITTGLNPSVRFLVIVFYLSICVFPVFFLTSNLVSMIQNYSILVETKIFIVLGLILFLSIIILWTFCDYFTTPLAKFKIAVQKIKAGDYNHHVDIVSNDDFGELADAFNDMSSVLDEKNKKIHAMQNSIIKGMAVMVESRDNSTGGHISRTSDCVKVFLDKLVQTEQGKSLSPSFCKAVIKAAPMHDLGKIAVDDAILRKPGKFTDEEYEVMKTHSAEGARIVSSVLAQVDDEEFKQIAINVAHYHHEKWDGNGYPEKIMGEEIPYEARIMALADVFDALVSKRCYKDSFNYDKAFQIIEESLGTHFDPQLGRAFIECRAELEQLYDGYKQ